MINIPVFISAGCVTLYWVTVIFKSIKLAFTIGRDPNVIPRERQGQVSRLIWLPTLLAWIILLWQGVWHIAAPQLLFNLPLFFRHFASFFVITATFLTFWCWHEMGSAWRIGIDPKEKTTLILTGPYQYVRHPIYSLSILLALSTWLTYPTIVLFIVLLLHIILLCLEARREEEHMYRIHGNAYKEYSKHTGYFMPRLFTPYQPKT